MKGRNSVKKKNIAGAGRRRRGRTAIVLAIVIILLAAAFFACGIISSAELVIRQFKLYYDNLPQNFDGYKIVQLTDLHGSVFGEGQRELIERVESCSPDIIVLTGDLMDSGDKEFTPAYDLCKGLVDIAPVLWVKGNHFYSADKEIAAAMEEALIELGVVLLSDESYEVEIEGQSIVIDGMDDPYGVFYTRGMPRDYDRGASLSIMKRKLESLNEEIEDAGGFKMLIVHRPCLAELLTEYDYSLVLAGHTHGGQICLPGGIEIIGTEGLFPQYKSGYIAIGSTGLIISSGLGCSNINLRLYNPPEIVEIQLKKD